MRVRLNKQQAKMLLDHKELSYGRTKYRIPQGTCEVRTLLEDYVNYPDASSKFDLFINVETGVIEMKMKGVKK